MIFDYLWAQLKWDFFHLEAIYFIWGQYLKSFNVPFKSLHIKLQMNANSISISSTTI